MLKKSQQHHGASLVELILFIVIISIALGGILLVMDNVTRNSADTLIRKQALAVAESLLEEIALQDFISASSASATCPHNQVTAANRASGYHIICDYNGFSMPTGITSVNGVAVTGLGSYNAAVTVVPAALGSGAVTIPAGSAVQITVTVRDPQNNPVQVSGYRTAY
jgi:MSHA pilin protein MshD